MRWIALDGLMGPVFVKDCGRMAIDVYFWLALGVL